MPTYEYECTACGGFSAVRRLAEYKEPQPCPDCGTPSPRALHTAPAYSGMPSTDRKAHAINERSAHEPRSSKDGTATGHRHGPGCGCGSGSIGRSNTVTASDGSKTFPAKRPWMISH